MSDSPSAAGSAVFIAHVADPEPWLGDFLAAVDGRFTVHVLDHDAPFSSQFRGAGAVVDLGGAGSVDMISAAADAGVRLWQVVGVGLDRTNVAEIEASGMALAHTPGSVSAIGLAETALLLMLALVKRLREAQENARAGRLFAPEGGELAGRTLGLVGLGASARELARRAKAFDMNVVAVDVAPIEPAAWRACGVDSFGPVEELDDLLAGSDYVSLHVPLVEATRSLIDRPRLALMRPEASIVNVARGGLIDEAALIGALTDGVIAGAGLDVTASEPLPTDHPLLAMDNVVLTPHIAGSTRESSRRRNEICADNVLRALEGRAPEYQVLPRRRRPA
ncbi:MAG TPA: NAD(P)-dependent oxidoreductase [Baekduia sp.]|nr:NAD(P)-dependent oxidoreductase [Baekduia sp.]